MKYEVKYACGHTGTVDLIGKEREREGKLKWYATLDCQECRLKKEKEKADADGYPELKGENENTLVWAYEIRNKKIPEIKDLMGTIRLKPERRPIWEKAVDYIINNDRAGFWVRYQRLNARSLIKEIIETKNIGI